jgi:hypothetical protein
MRALCLLALIATPALAEPTRDWSAEIAGKGLAATASDIAALSAPTPDDRFALAITRFLGGIEQALAARYSVGQSDALELLPVFRLPLPPNPNPAPFDPALVETTFKGINQAMDDSRTALAAIPLDAELSLTLRLGDIWFDVNRSGTRDPGEGAAELAGAILSLDTPLDDSAAAKLPAVTFDRADAAWLSAYSHLLSATGEAVLAFAPTGPITRVMEGRKALVDKGADSPLETFVGGAPRDAATPNPTDYAAMLLLTLRQTPDTGRIHAARDHLLAMIADNRRFWTELETETDDHQEWIPNARQKGALPAPLPQGLGASWQAVLSDAEMLVKGERLIPYMDGTTGFDLGAWFEKPSSLDAVEWLHGMGLAPYLRQGPLVSTQNWRAFDDLMAGQGRIFAFWLN